MAATRRTSTATTATATATTVMVTAGVTGWTITDVTCEKKDMLLVNYESPDGAKRHKRLWNGGNGIGTVQLFGPDGKLIDAHSRRLRHNEMPEFMKEHEQPENENRGKYRYAHHCTSLLSKNPRTKARARASASQSASKDGCAKFSCASMARSMQS